MAFPATFSEKLVLSFADSLASFSALLICHGKQIDRSIEPTQYTHFLSPQSHALLKRRSSSDHLHQQHRVRWFFFVIGIVHLDCTRNGREKEVPWMEKASHTVEYLKNMQRAADRLCMEYPGCGKYLESWSTLGTFCGRGPEGIIWNGLGIGIYQHDKES